MSGINLTQEDRRLKEHRVRDALMRCKGVRGFRTQECIAKMRVGSGWSQRVQGWGKRCLGMVLMTREWHRQVRIGQTGVGLVTVMTCTVLAC